MATVRVKVDGSGLLDYAKAGRDAVREVKKAMSRVLNLGRKEARQRIASQFTSRTGFLRRQARRMQTQTIVTQAEVKGRVTPIPRLMNIFEDGATIPARTIQVKNAKALMIVRPPLNVMFARSAQVPSVSLRARPVVQPAADLMEKRAPEEFERIIKQVGK